jgi:hypothetical protein
MYVKPLCLLLSGVLKSAFNTDQPCGGDVDCPRWICLIAVITGALQGLSVFCAIRAMKDVYGLLRHDIAPLKAGWKFLCVWLTMMLTVIQIISLFYLITYKWIVITPELGLDTAQSAPFADQFLSRLLCVELVLVAFAFSRAFALNSLPELLEASEQLRASFITGSPDASYRFDSVADGGTGGEASEADTASLLSIDSSLARSSPSRGSNAGNYWRYPRSESGPASTTSINSLPQRTSFAHRYASQEQDGQGTVDAIWRSGDYEYGYAVDETTGLPRLSGADKLAMVYSFPTPQKPSITTSWSSSRHSESVVPSKVTIRRGDEVPERARRGRSSSPDNTARLLTSKNKF